MPANPAPHDRLLAGLRALGSVSEAERAALAELPLTLQALPVHRDIVIEGQQFTTCCLVLQGLLCRHTLVSGSARQILSLHVPGDLADLQGLHFGVADFSLGALTPSQVALIPHTALRAAVEAAPGLGALLSRATVRDAAISRRWLASVGRRPAYQRIAHLLCEMHTRTRLAHPEAHNGVALPMSQTDIADALGLSPVHVNRTMQQLRRDGLIASKGHFHGFYDWERLRKAADFDSAYLFEQSSALPHR